MCRFLEFRETTGSVTCHPYTVQMLSTGMVDIFAMHHEEGATQYKPDILCNM